MNFVVLFTCASLDIEGGVQLNTGTLGTMWCVHLGWGTGVKGFFVQH